VVLNFFWIARWPVMGAALSLLASTTLIAVLKWRALKESPLTNIGNLLPFQHIPKREIS